MSVMRTTDRRLPANSVIEWCGRRLLPIIAIGILFGGFFAYPLSSVIWRSFQGFAFDLQGYARMLNMESGPYVTIFFRTIAIAAYTTLFCVVLAYPVAYVLSVARPLTVAIMIPLFMVPLFTAILIRTYAWIIIFGRKGLINTILISLGLIEQPLRMIYTSFAVYVGMVNVLLPVAVFTMYSVMVQIDRNVMLAAEVMGANPIRSFTRVYFPLSLPGVIAAAVLVFILSLGFFITPSLLGGTGDTMITQLISTQVGVLLNLEFGYVLATTLLIITFVILSLAGMFIPLEMLWSAARDPLEAGRRHRRWRDTERIRVAALALSHIRSVILNMIEKILFLMVTPILRLRSILLNSLVGLIMVFLIAPLPIVILVSFSSSPFLVFPPPGFSFQWYVKFFTSEAWRTAAVFSILLGVATSLVAVFVGTLSSFLIVRGQFRWKRGLFFFLLSPLMVPHIILAIAFYGFFNDLALLGTFQGLVIAHAVMATPYAVVVMSTTLRGFDQDLEHAAATLGATPTRTLRKVTFPILRPALLTAGLLAFLLSFDELLVTLFLLGRLPRTLPLQFWSDITIMIDPVISAASSMIVLGVIGLITLGQWMKYRQEKRLALRSYEQVFEPIVAGEHA